MKEYKRLTDKKINLDKLSEKAKSRISDTYLEYARMNNALWEIENKIDNGTLVELPCKIGDTIYWANIYRPTPKVEEYKVYGFRINDKIAVQIDFNSFLYLEEINFTKAEAETKLKELQNDNSNM